MSYKKNAKITYEISNYKDMQNNPLPKEKINHKIKIEGDDEFYILKAPEKPSFFKKGNVVSFSYNTWTPKGDNALTRYYIKQVEEVLDDPLKKPSHDDLPQAEKEWLAAPAEQPTDFSPVSYEKEAVMDKKGLIIFVQGMLQASIRAGNFKVDEINESTVANLIDLYKKITK